MCVSRESRTIAVYCSGEIVQWYVGAGEWIGRESKGGKLMPCSCLASGRTSGANPVMEQMLGRICIVVYMHRKCYIFIREVIEAGAVSEKKGWRPCSSCQGRQ